MQKIKFSSRQLFWLILTLAFILRFYKLGLVPLTLDWDENSNAYNAYSILKTGRDEYGQFLPITNRSFDDYKPPAYMYLNVITVKLFGLTPFATRLPSAVFGFLTVPLIYFLAKKLFAKESIALVSMFLLTISPWHLQFSRVGFEATIGLFAAVAAISAFLYGLKDHKWLIAAALALGLSSYTYHTQRIFVPLLFVATFFTFKSEIAKIPKRFLITFITISILIGLPLVILIPPKVILQRFEVTTGRPKLEDIEKSIKFILQDQEIGLDLGKYIHNRRFVIAQSYLGNYLSHFDFNFLFTKGDDNFRHHIGDMGMLYLFEFPLVLYGIYHFARFRTKATIFVLLWLLIAPVAATPATPNPHANRSLPLIVGLELIAAYSLVSIFSLKIPLQKYVFLFTTAWIMLSFIIYLHNYYSHYPYEKASFWQFGYNQAVQESEKLRDQYEKILIAKTIEQAYIFWLFNTKYDPTSYQQLGTRYHFDKYYFEVKPPSSKNELFISDAEIFPGNFEVVKIIYYPDGKEAIKIGHPR